jgi:hypothetical protein
MSDNELGYGTYTGQGFAAWADAYIDNTEINERKERLEDERKKRRKVEWALEEKAYIKWRKSKAIMLIAGLHNNDQIFNKIIKSLLYDGLEVLAKRYARSESLPLAYVQVALENEGLEILIKNYLKHEIGEVLTAERVNEIKKLSSCLHINDDLEIVYDRVSKIQSFIHKKANEKNGENAYTKLPVEETKNLLSAARLHLSIFDIKNKDINYLFNEIKASKIASLAEITNPRKVILPEGKKNIKNWRVRHLRSTTYFLPVSVRGMINEIFRIEKNLPSYEFIRRVLEIYS